MPRRRGNRNRTSDSGSGPESQQNSDYVIIFVVYWAYAHFWIARKCFEKVNKLLLRLYGFDHQTSEILYQYWTNFTALSFILPLLFLYVVVQCVPVLYIIAADMTFMCIFWISEQ